MIVGKAATLDNGRWVLASNGNGAFYEDGLAEGADVKQILSAVNGNAIVFNYPGVDRAQVYLTDKQWPIPIVLCSTF